jgi:hypothetical protein
LPIALGISSFVLSLMLAIQFALLSAFLAGAALPGREGARGCGSEWEWPCPESEARGLKLLKEWLSPLQRTTYESLRYFDVVGCDSGKIYRIHHGMQGNVEQLDATGQPVFGWCFAPVNTFVIGDVMLAQKIALETYECRALRVANRLTIIASR